jgi:Patatin-like phospholipase
MTVGRIALGLVVAILLAGCASADSLRVVRADTIGPCRTTVPEGDLLVGVALSGGGSRAALFGAAGLQALAGVRVADGTSAIDRISHLSSVSGGSIAAAYYALRKPGQGVNVFNPDGALSDAYRTFFAQYPPTGARAWSFPFLDRAPGRGVSAGTGRFR